MGEVAFGSRSWRKFAQLDIRTKWERVQQVFWMRFKRFSAVTSSALGTLRKMNSPNSLARRSFTTFSV